MVMVNGEEDGRIILIGKNDRMRDNMRIWLIKTGEGLPIDGPNTRLLRTGMLAEKLVERGHDVVWWTSSFNHSRKTQRTYMDERFRIKINYIINVIHTRGYKKNVSFARIADHIEMANKFYLMAKKEKAPDIIFCALPTLSLARVVTHYGLIHNIPVVLDIRDLWPDIFIDIIPPKLKWLATICLTPVNQICRKACRNAIAITGITEPFVKWALIKGNRNPTEWDRAFYLGYRREKPSPDQVLEANCFWERMGVYNNRKQFIACFFGTLGRQFDIETLINAARIVQNEDSEIKFVICGDGDDAKYYKDTARDCKNVIFPGWVDSKQIWSLLQMSAIGLTPYINNVNFQKSIPNKPAEYFSAGLPVISSLKGELERLLITYNCGINYDPGDASDLARIILKLKHDPDLILQMSANARILFNNQFDADSIYNSLVTHLEKICYGKYHDSKRY